MIFAKLNPGEGSVSTDEGLRGREDRVSPCKALQESYCMHDIPGLVAIFSYGNEPSIGPMAAPDTPRKWYFTWDCGINAKNSQSGLDVRMSVCQGRLPDQNGLTSSSRWINRRRIALSDWQRLLLPKLEPPRELMERQDEPSIDD